LPEGTESIRVTPQRK